MEIAQRTHLVRPQASRNGWIILGYVALAVIALVAIYFASAGPGITDGDLAVMTAMP